jgi:hypothetical protein
MTFPLIRMTREAANQILDLWRSGKQTFPARVIDIALYATGDLESLR